MVKLFRRLWLLVMTFITVLMTSATLGAILTPNPNVYLPVQVMAVLLWGLMTFLCVSYIFSWKDTD